MDIINTFFKEAYCWWYKRKPNENFQWVDFVSCGCRLVNLSYFQI